MKKIINNEIMANRNGANVLDIIQKNKVISRKQITELSGLSWGGMTKIVNKLLEGGYITEKKQEENEGSGRIPSLISVNNERNFVIGLDINRTGLKAVVMNLSGESLMVYSSEVKSEKKLDLLDEIINFIAGIFEDFSADVIIACGIAMQGIVDEKQGISVMLPWVSDWKDVPVKEILERRFNKKFYIEHDPDCMLYPYINNKEENIMLMRVDKSIGMAVSLNGKILKSKGILEIAHNIVIPNGKECICGQMGCIEAYIRPCLESGEIKSVVISEFASAFSIIVKNMTELFNIDRLILTGELIKHKHLFEPLLFCELEKLKCKTKVIFSEKSDNAMLGSALIAVNKSINELEI